MVGFELKELAFFQFIRLVAGQKWDERWLLSALSFKI